MMIQRMIISIFAMLLAFSANAAEYIVKQKYNKFLSVEAFEGMRVIDTHGMGGLFKVDIPEGQEMEKLSDLLRNPDVEYVVENFELKAFTAPVNILKLKEQWANTKVKAEEAWKLAGNKGSRDIIIAVIDTGVDYKHESLVDNMIDGYDFRDDDNDPMDETSDRNPGHGTHCAGSAGASGLVDDGVIGLSPEVSIMPIRFLGADGSGDLMQGIKAVDYAIEKEAHIISASWGATVGREQAKPLIEAVQRADDAGVIFVAAAANDGRSNDKVNVFPTNAGTKNMIAVAASGPQDEKPQWSNFGKYNVDVASPGLDIMSTFPGNKYGSISGTSMATPLVSGLVALLLAQDDTLTGAEVRSLMQSTAAKVQIETACDCRVDAEASVKSLQAQDMLVVPWAADVFMGETETFTARNAQAPLTFESTDTAIATIDDQGVLTTVAEGETTIKITDAAGNIAESYKIYVHSNTPDDRGGGGIIDICPPGWELICAIGCMFFPDFPLCQMTAGTYTEEDWMEFLKDGVAEKLFSQMSPAQIEQLEERLASAE